MKLKATRVLRFTKGTEFDDGFWHVAEDPCGDDRTLCGLAHEGMGNSLRFDTYKAKQGHPTCRNCNAIIEFCLTLKP